MLSSHPVIFTLVVLGIGNILLIVMTIIAFCSAIIYVRIRKRNNKKIHNERKNENIKVPETRR